MYNSTDPNFFLNFKTDTKSTPHVFLCSKKCTQILQQVIWQIVRSIWGRTRLVHVLSGCQPSITRGRASFVNRWHLFSFTTSTFLLLSVFFKSPPVSPHSCVRGRHSLSRFLALLFHSGQKMFFFAFFFYLFVSFIHSCVTGWCWWCFSTSPFFILTWTRAGYYYGLPDSGWNIIYSYNFLYYVFLVVDVVGFFWLSFVFHFFLIIIIS